MASQDKTNDCDTDCICCSIDENKLNMIMHILENDAEINKLLKNPKIADAFSKFCNDTNTEDDLKDTEVNNFFQYLQFKIQLMSKMFVINKKSKL